MIHASKLTEYHGEYSKIFKFNVPLHPKNLSQLIHPFHGYLTAYPNRWFSYDDLIEVYTNQIASGYEKSFGRELLGDELSCLSFYLLTDAEKKGWLNLEEAKDLLKAFKFDHLFIDQEGKEDDVLTYQKIAKEFAWNLKSK
jgi:hypothetical protein